MSQLLKNIDDFFANKTEEELEEIKKKYFPECRIPKGWVSIEEHLPKCRAVDLFNGGTKYKVRYNDGVVGCTMVLDHNIWYVEVKSMGITHWLNE